VPSNDITANDCFLLLGGIITAVDPNMMFDIDGARHKNKDKLEEWCQFKLLHDMKLGEERTQQHSRFSFELICFSVTSELRTDKKFNRHYELAEIYRPYLEQIDYPIKNSCLRLNEVKISYLDLRTSTFTAKAIATGGVPPLQTVCAVMQADAHIITNKG